MFEGGEEAETDFLARLRKAARFCKIVDLSASKGLLQFIAELRDSESRLTLFDALSKRQLDGGLSLKNPDQMICWELSPTFKIKCNWTRGKTWSQW